MSEVYKRRQILRDLAVTAAFALCWFGGMTWALGHGWYPFSEAVYVLAGLWTTGQLAVGLRRQREVFVLTVVGYPLAWTAVGPSFGLYEELLLVPLLLAAYRVASSGRLAIRWALPVSVLVVAVVTVQAAGLGALAARPYTAGQPLGFDDLDVSQLLFQEAVTAAFVLLGHAEHQRHRAMAMLAARNRELERLRQVQAGQVVVAERTRIARELHDVVAHHVSAIAIRAQAADRVADRRPDQPREAVRWIATAAQDALGSMRRVVDILQTPPTPPTPPDPPSGAAPTVHGPTGALLRPAGLVTAPHAPDAGLDELTDIVARVTGAGVPVALTVSELPTLPAHIELAALRIVQEALTNVLLHARASRAAVDIACHSSQLQVSIADDGPGVPAAAVDPDAQPGTTGRHGNGLPGMRARAELCGGTLTVEPGARGGWHVHACLPLETPRPGRLPAPPASAAGTPTSATTGRAPVAAAVGRTR